MLKLSNENPESLYAEMLRSIEFARKLLTLVQRDGITDEKFRKSVNYEDIRLYQTFKGGITDIILNGQDLSKYVLRNKDVPGGDAKRVEMATRAFLSVKRPPNKPISWLERNLRHLEYLYSTKDLPEKSLGSESMFRLGDFTLHNTIGAGGRDIEEIVRVVRTSSELVRSSGVPHAQSLLYGEVLVVGRLLGANTLAWYNPSRDDISIRAKSKFNHNVVKSLTHELGHRLWRKFLGMPVKSEWGKWHDLCYFNTKVTMPEVGEKLLIQVGRKKNPVVQRIEGLNFFIAEDQYVTWNQLYKVYKGIQGYPTAYAATNEEEHFCEAFALYCLDELEAKHKGAFESIIIRGDTLEDYTSSRVIQGSSVRRRRLTRRN